jgi:hypothetical protein
MPDDFLGDRRKALENQFFQEREERLLAELRKRREAEVSKEALSQASGITDETVLLHLVEAGIAAETLAALSLVPLVEVAWADGTIDRRERNAILDAAEEGGLGKDTPAHHLLGSWLDRRPAPELIEAWRGYVAELCAGMPSGARSALMRDLLGRAREVAEAAGGFLGLGRRVSDDEQRVLDRLATAFQ